MDVTADQLKAAVESAYQATATLFYVAHVIGLGPASWDGQVHVFDLEGHPTASRAYAWTFPSLRDSAPRIRTALHVDGMRGAYDAVQLAIRSYR